MLCMKSLRELLLRIDEINKTIAENDKNFSKKVKENRIKLKNLEEQKKREGLHRHRSAVESIERQIRQLRDEDVTSTNLMLNVEKKKCLNAFKNFTKKSYLGYLYISLPRYSKIRIKNSAVSSGINFS